MNSREEFIEKLKSLQGKHVLVIGHDSPDGDCIGSSLGMSYLLKEMGAIVTLVNVDTIEESFEYLKGEIWFKKYEDLSLAEKSEIEEIVMVDCGELKRISIDLRENFKNAKNIFNIDHHISNNNYGDFNLVEIIGSTSEIVTSLYLQLKIDVKMEAAKALSTGIMTDTGSLTFSQTTKETFLKMAYLWEHGGTTFDMRKNLFENGTKEKILMEKKILNTLEFDLDDKIAYIFFTYEDFVNSGLSKGDMAAYTGIPRKIKTCDIAIYFKEYEKDVIKVSIRTKEPVDGNKIAGYFGGGGHIRAAGFEVKGNLEDVIKETVEIIKSGYDKWIN